MKERGDHPPGLTNNREVVKPGKVVTQARRLTKLCCHLSGFRFCGRDKITCHLEYGDIISSASIVIANPQVKNLLHVMESRPGELCIRYQGFLAWWITYNILQNPNTVSSGATVIVPGSVGINYTHTLPNPNIVNSMATVVAPHLIRRHSLPRFQNPVRCCPSETPITDLKGFIITCRPINSSLPPSLAGDAILAPTKNARKKTISRISEFFVVLV